MTRRRNSSPPMVSLDFEELMGPNDYLPEKRLIIAIIQRAVIDFTCPEKGRGHLQYDAAAWIFSPSRIPFSLWWCCDILSAAPDDLHRRIQVAVKAQGAKKPKCVIMRVDR